MVHLAVVDLANSDKRAVHQRSKLENTAASKLETLILLHSWKFWQTTRIKFRSGIRRPAPFQLN